MGTILINAWYDQGEAPRRFPPNVDIKFHAEVGGTAHISPTADARRCRALYWRVRQIRAGAAL